MDDIKTLFDEKGVFSILMDQIHDNPEFLEDKETNEFIDHKINEKLDTFLEKQNLNDFTSFKGELEKREDRIISDEDLGITQNEFDAYHSLIQKIAKAVLINKAKTDKNVKLDDFEQLIEKYKLSGNNEKADELENVKEILGALLESKISLAQILTDKTVVPKLKNSKNEVAKVIGDNYDEFISSIPSLIKVLTIKYLGISKKGIGISKPTLTFQCGTEEDIISRNTNYTEKEIKTYGYLLIDGTSQSYEQFEKNLNQSRNAYIQILPHPMDNRITNQYKALHYAKHAIPYQGFTKVTDVTYSKKTKILDGKFCGLIAILKSLVYSLNQDNESNSNFKSLKNNFVNCILEDYTLMTNALDLKKSLSKLLYKKDYVDLAPNEKPKIDVLVPLLDTSIESGPLREIGLLPEDMVKRYSGLGVKYVSADSFEEIEEKMKVCLKENLLPCPLVYHDGGGMHYYPIVEYNEDKNKYYYDESDHILRFIKTDDLKKKMTFKKKSISEKLNNPIKTKEKIDIFLGEGRINDLVKIIKDVIMNKTGGRNQQTEDGIKYIFLVVDRKDKLNFITS